MPPRRRIDLRAVHAANANRNPDDSRPWFLVRFLPPPPHCTVRLAWPDGATNGGSLLPDGRWDCEPWHSDKPRRSSPPVAWKPLGIGASHGIGNPHKVLPNPLEYGFELRPG